VKITVRGGFPVSGKDN